MAATAAARKPRRIRLPFARRYGQLPLKFEEFEGLQNQVLL